MTECTAWYHKIDKIPGFLKRMVVQQYGALCLSMRYAKIDRALRRASVWESRMLAEARRLHEASYQQQDHPLVSVIIPTYNRGQLLTERTLPSVLNQTYQNWEAIVVGDCCTDDTEERIARLGDDRVHFYNLPERGKYPKDPYFRWMVAGCAPANQAFAYAKGEWIAHLDDDDLFTPDHLEVLLSFASKGNHEFVYGRFMTELEPGVWRERGRPTFMDGHPPYRGEGIQGSSVMYRSYLRFITWDMGAWRYGLPADYWRWNHMGRVGVRAGYLPQIVCSQPLRPGETELTNVAALKSRARAKKVGPKG